MKNVRAIHIPEHPQKPVLLFLANGNGIREVMPTRRQYRRLCALWEQIRGDYNHPRYTATMTVMYRAIRVRQHDPIFDRVAGTIL